MRLLPTSSDGLSELAPFASARLLALDIDGTLPSISSGRIGDLVGDLQRSLANHRRGVRLTVATGRTFTASARVIEELGLARHTLVILYNGALIATSDGTSVLTRKVIAPSSVFELVEVAKRAGLRVYVFSASLALQPGRGSSLVETVQAIDIDGTGPRYFGGLTVDWTTASALDARDTTAVLLEVSAGEVAATRADRLRAAHPSLAVAYSAGRYVEVSAPGTTKALALEDVTRTLGLDRAEVIAVGDNENDVAMLRWAGIGVAVRNASEAAKAASDYLTNEPAGDGVVELLRLLRTATRYRRANRRPS